MLKVLYLIIKHHFYILFIIFEIIAIQITINTNNFYSSKIFNLTNEIAGKIHSAYYSLSKFYHTINENKKLSHQNSLLIKYYLNKKYNENLNSQESLKVIYDVIPANVIYFSRNKPENFLVINKGRKDSIYPDMGVICPEGVVGITYACSDNFCIVLPIINIKAHLSAVILKENFHGTTEWDGKNFKLVKLTDIPNHAKIKKGDTVTTSGQSLIFPKGIPIGKVYEFKNVFDKNSVDITVELFTDFSKLDYVFIIKNKMKNEFLKLLKDNKLDVE
ncbi:MAG: rod shape-determining protein MreC [Bacteroidales bacterium]|nr:rod shape-determining protein MreC [Bacteroidales bacterium]